MSGAAEAPLVTLAHGGRLRGVWEQGLRVFRGVPYAMAPYGRLRFAAPVPAQPWSGVRDATTFAPVAPQLARNAREDAPAFGGEGCLAVNVWAPPAEPGAAWPVMVWVHGGGFFRGSSSDPLYDGASFARQGVVFVSLQYRLGIDGFLHFEGDEECAPPNRGLLDQIAALRWVQEHIHAWGGDPAQVTVFGQSAGAGALACLLGMDASRGLFRRAILQSPSIACQTVQEAACVRRAVGALAGVAPSRVALGAAPVERVLHAVHRLAAEPALRLQHGIGVRNFFPLRPVVDGQVLRAHPLQSLRQQWSAVPPAIQVLVGSNRDEMNLYHVPGRAIDHITESQVLAFVHDVGLPPEAVAVYEAALPWGQRSPGALLSALQSDFYYRVPARRIALLAAQWAESAHQYEFAWASPQWRGRLGAAHGVELPFVFANLQTPQGLEFTGPMPPQDLVQAMHHAWARFVRDGNPGWAPCGVSAPWLQTFDDVLCCEIHSESARFSVWEGVL